MNHPYSLSRRERQIMDILHRRGAATVHEVRRDLPDPPSDSAVRSALYLLEKKGRVTHKEDGRRNVYSPTLPREEARENALRHVVRTFFEGSRALLLSALLDPLKTTEEDLDRMEQLIHETRSKREEVGE